MSTDITKCRGEGCDIKDVCFRFLVAPDAYQSYFCESPIKDNVCDMFWGIVQQGMYTQLDSICKGEKK